jgi:ribonuclease BN (tRNA processing enzyme)
VEESLDELRGFIDQMAARNHWPPARKEQFAAHMEKEHLTVDSLGELASKAQVQSVVFYHYDPQDKAEQQARVAEMKKYFHGPVLAPMDLDRFCLSKDEAGSEKAKFESCGQKMAEQE